MTCTFSVPAAAIAGQDALLRPAPISGDARDDLPPVGLQGREVTLGLHDPEVEADLGHAGGLEALRSCRGPAAAVPISVRRSAMSSVTARTCGRVGQAVLAVVVARRRPSIPSTRSAGRSSRAIVSQQVLDVVRHRGGEAAHAGRARARGPSRCRWARRPRPRSRSQRPAGLRAPRARVLHRPLHDAGRGELQDEPVGLGPGQLEDARPVGGDAGRAPACVSHGKLDRSCPAASTFSPRQRLRISGARRGTRASVMGDSPSVRTALSPRPTPRARRGPRRAGRAWPACWPRRSGGG